MGDAHYDARTAGFPRFDDVRDALNRAADAAIEQRADCFIFGGDLCDPGSPELVRAICAAQDIVWKLDQGGVTSYWLSGNHDTFEDGHGTTTLDPIDQFGREFGSYVIKEPVCDDERYSGIGFLPYVENSRSYDPAAVVRGWAAEGKMPKLVVGHLMLEGIAAGSETADFPRGRDVFWPLDELDRLFPDAVLVAAHFHKPQVFGRVQVVGSLCNLTRAEIGNVPGYLVIDL